MFYKLTKNNIKIWMFSIIAIFSCVIFTFAYYDDGWDGDGYYDDWEWGEDMLPEEAFDEYFYGSGLPVEKYDELLDEYLGSGIGAEEFIEGKINDSKIKENKYDKKVDNKKNKHIPTSKNAEGYRVQRTDGNIYQYDASGMLVKGWYHYQNGMYDKWYYYDLETGAMVKNKLIEWDGKVYYILDGEMVVNKIVNINGVDIVIDKDGVCSIKSEMKMP